MDINLTLFGQAITFAIFVWFTMKYVWPPMMAAITERQEKIADGLAAARKGEETLEQATEQVAQMLSDAKKQAAEIIEQGNKRASNIVEEAKSQAVSEGKRLIEAAKSEIEQEANRTRESLRGEVAGFVLLGAEKILEQSIDQSAHDALLSKLAANM